MGMEVQITLADVPESTARRAAQLAFAAVATLDARLSDYRVDSDVRAIERAAPDALTVHSDVMAVLLRALDIARDSGGAFDPTVAPVVAVWREARAVSRLPSVTALSDARGLVGWSKVERDPERSTVRLPVTGMRLDLGGVAKGFILQRALEVLRDAGAPVALIEAGGDIVAGAAKAGSSGWRIQVGCRLDGGGDDVALLINESLATSGATAQFFELGGRRYSHVIDPRSGQALTDHHAVHVRASDGATADAWATALSVLGPVGALEARVPSDVRYCFQ